MESILSLCEEYVPGDPPEFFFDRNPQNFGTVLEMYRSGKLPAAFVGQNHYFICRSGKFHIIDGGRGCAVAMKRDFEYWGLDELALEPCCSLTYYPNIEVNLPHFLYIISFPLTVFNQLCNTQIEGDILDRETEEQELKEENFGLNWLGAVR